jgi:membrane protease subunit HflC
MKITRLVLVAVALLVLSIFSGVFFIVHEGESALIIQLGQVKRAPITEAGLYLKTPFVDEVVRFEKRVMAWDGDPERIPVKDDKFIFVDTFARWRITDPARFYNAVRDERGAQSRLDDILDGSVRDVVSTHFLLELVRTTNRPLALDEVGTSSGAGAVGTESNLEGKRIETRQKIVDLCRKKLAEVDLGMELVDLRIKRIDYTDQVRDDVYRRMISQQERIAERYRAQGEGKRAEIAGLTEQEKRRIDSESYRRAQELLGEAEAESTRIYAEAYGRDADFYRFVESLAALRVALGSDDTLVLSTNNELLGYLEGTKSR